LLNVYVVKHLLMIVTGTAEAAQLVSLPEFQTGYLPVVTKLLVKTNQYIGGLLRLFPTNRMPPSASANPVM